MTKMLLSLLMIFISIIMFFLNHPLSMGMLILFQTLLLCLIFGMLINTYWFFYILFLTFFGGLLVFFIFVSGIAANEFFFSTLKKKIMLFFLSIFVFIMSTYLMNNMYWLNILFNDEMLNFFNEYLFNNYENNINLSKLYNNQTYLIMMMMIIYLFITLIAIVKITNIFFGPLRSYN
uniref:NADH-ubiquinone oxidoreductase chain 6 n=1 Tax=Curetis bulis TaxID=124389 RepID=V5J1E9_CURBU|nr:NADH dehydrogenase subunit 6 [Curetis bulis]AFV13319.1 NADH dehydrogenase subunit 6 [Curetis bulis]